MCSKEKHRSLTKQTTFKSSMTTTRSTRRGLILQILRKRRGSGSKRILLLVACQNCIIVIFCGSLSSSSSFSLFLVSPPIRLFSLRLQFVVIVASMAFFSESISQLNKMCCWHLLFHREVFWCCRQEWRSERLIRAHEISKMLQDVIQTLWSDANSAEVAKLGLAFVSWSMTI